MSRKAIIHLKKSDPRMAAVIERVGPCRFATRVEGTHFDALLRAIVYQQISGTAAATIHARLEALYGGRAPTPDELLDTPESDLKAAGLSRQKLGYMKDLAERVSGESLPIHSLDDLDDDAVIAALTAVKGIGRWTAQMFLMFRLGRPDVLPEIDFGIQKAIMVAYELPEMPKPKDVIRIGTPWRPHATIASWYLWRSLDKG
jgi:DNA-3-methyladenine glycosylase II